MSEYGRMTDTERDQIDQDAQTFMRTCSEAIQQLRGQAHKDVASQQVKEHRTAVVDFVEDYLKRVCRLYSEQRAIRVKRLVDKKRLSKLEPEPNTKRRESVSSEKVSQDPSKDSEEKSVAEEFPEKIPAEAQPELGIWGDGRGEDELSPEETQMFEQENQRLIGEMNSLCDEVRSKGKWLKSPDSRTSSQRRFCSRKPTSTASTSSLSGQPRTSRRATKTSERPSRTTRASECGCSSSW
nr:syntaxin 18 [Rousettus aegyptiacus]